MATAYASDYPHDDLRDDESILDDDVIEADHGKWHFTFFHRCPMWYADSLMR